MMKFKKAVVFILCAIMAVSMFACRKAPTAFDNDDIEPTVTYTVTFNVGDAAAAAGVTVTPSSAKVYQGATLGSAFVGGVPRPTTYVGFTFGGWYTQPDGGGVAVTESTKIYSNYDLIAKWISNEEVEEEAKEYEESLTAANGWKSGHLYIHYKRYSHDAAEESLADNTGAPEYNDPIGSAVYDDWGLWAWPKNADGRLFYPWRIDMSGEVFDIELNHTYNDAGWDEVKKEHKDTVINFDTNDGSKVEVVSFQLFSVKSRSGADFWANDGGDNDLVLADIVRVDGTYHWFVTQGNVTTGSSSLSSSASSLVDPYKGTATGSQITRTTPGNGIINSAVDSSYPQVTSRAAGWDEDAVGYQIFIASFCDSDGDGMGDLQGVISKLDYLNDLNVDVLWLTPFQSSTNYHGYDIKDYYSVDSRFGTIADYRELVYKAHQKGMKVIMDFVLNHTSRSNPWFVKSQNLVVENEGTENEIDYRQFYTWINQEQYDALPEKQKNGIDDKKTGRQWYGPLNGNGSEDDGYYFYSSFSSDMPELNYDYQPVRDAILDVCNYWMSFGIDGFRLDAVKHIYMVNELVDKAPSDKIVVDTDDSYNYDMKRNLNFYREFNARLKANYPNAFMVGENLDGDPSHIADYYQGIDSQFDFNLYYDAARAFAQSTGTITQNNETTSASWMSAALKAYITSSTAYSGVYKNYIGGQFTSNHDLPRARDRVNIKHTVASAGGIDDEYASLYTNNSIDGKAFVDSNGISHAAGTLDTTAVNRTDVLLRLYYAFEMMLPGVTWIYYGDEIGMSGIMQYTLDSGSTSTTSSEAHEDRIYRQPMKWYSDMTKNKPYSIGFSDYKAELTGYNASSALKGVDDQLTDPDSLLRYVMTLTEIRDKYGLGNSKLSNAVQGGNTISYTLTGTKGTVKVYIYANATAPTTVTKELLRYNATVGSVNYTVLIDGISGGV